MSERERLLQCHNCHRLGNGSECGDECVDAYKVDVRDYQIEEYGVFRRKYCNLKVSDYKTGNGNLRRVPLCWNCRRYFESNGKRTTSGLEYVWPAMLWQWLSTDDLEESQFMRLWSIVPEVWRGWWLDEVRSFRFDASDISETNPPSVIVDVTNEKGRLEKAIEDLGIVELKRVVNELMYPLVKCPYGCTEYYHKTGEMSLEDVITHFFQQHGIAMKRTARMETDKIRGIRSDYLDPEVCLVEEFAWNPSWRVRPSLCFMDRGGGFEPVILTCRHHNGGSRKMFLHPPRSPFNCLPAEGGDQLAAAVVVPRTIKPMRPGKFSHTSRMHHVRGFFGGVDTISVSDRGRFESMSYVGRRNESVSVAGRADMKALVLHMKMAQDVIPAWLASSILQVAEEKVPRIEKFNMCWKGATYVTLEDSVKLQLMCRNNGFDSVNVRDNDGNVESVQFRGQWQKKLTWIHDVSEHGAKFPSIPALRCCGLDSHVIWWLMAMHVTVPAVWESTVDAVMDASEWHGWLLTYVTLRCFSRRCRKGSQSPFSFRGLQSQQSQDGKIVSLFSGLMPEVQHCIDENSGLADFETMRCLFAHSECIVVSKDCFNSADIDPHHTVVVVMNVTRSRHESGDCVALPLDDVGDQKGCAWELRFISSVMSCIGDRWIGKAYARHGGPSFPKWWKLARDRRGVSSVCKVHEDLSYVCEQWEVAVYVRTQLHDVDYLRDKFLTSINGQDLVYCGVHDVPFVIAPYRSQGNCSVRDVGCGNECGKSAFYSCPFATCEMHVCKVHHSQLVTTKRDRIYIHTEANDDQKQFRRVNTTFAMHSNDMENDVEESAVDDVNCIGTSEGHECVHDVQRCLAIDQNDDDDSHSETCLFVDTPFDVCLPDDDEEDASVGDARVASIPTTNCNSFALEVRSNKRNYIGGHVLLNNCGTLLVRKKQKLHGTRQQQHFLQRIATTSPGKSIPLLYPEGMLFPSLFWKDDGIGEAILGAIPCALLSHDSVLRENGLAGLGEHLRARLTDASFGGSFDFRYICYAFDNALNLGCRGEDTRVVLNRGVEVASSAYGVRVRGRQEALFDTDCIDSRPVVNRLAAAVAQQQATYFYTHTCNQNEHFGVCKIKQWIDSSDILDHLCHNPSCIDERIEVRRCIVSASSVLLCRNWMEVCELWMAYIFTSPEQPLGKISKIWWRHEYQDTRGNLSHIHALLWLDNDTVDNIQERIRGSLSTLVRPEEIDQYIEDGLLSSVRDLLEVHHKAEKFLRHRCSERCMKRVGIRESDLQCRVTNNALQSQNPWIHTVEDVQVCHSELALVVLQKLGLYSQNPLNGNLEPIHDLLRATKHYPPASAAEGNISACSGRLFVANPCNQNLKIVTGYLSSRYLAKYVAGVDENNRVYVGANPNDCHAVELQCEFLHNTKVTGSAIQEQKRLQNRRDKHHPTGRAISEMEMIAILLGYDQIHTNIKFVHIPTVPLEERPAVEIASCSQATMENNAFGHMASMPADLDSNLLIPSYEVRRSNDRMPLWRQWSSSELLILKDQIQSPFSVDRTTLFGLRPPELRFVKRQYQYFRWFKRERLFSNGCSNMNILRRLRILLHHNLTTCHWVDGTNHQIRLRASALDEIVGYLRTECNDATFYAREHIEQGLSITEESPLFKTTRLMRMLLFRHSSPPRSKKLLDEWYEMKERYLCETESEHCLPVTWYNSVRPTQPNRFLFHLLFSMGEFDNEVNLLSGSCIRDCFIKAGLIDARPNYIEQSIERLTRRYILEQLVFLPGGSQQFDKFVISAHRALREALLHDKIVVDELPPTLYTRLQMQVSEETTRYLQSLKTTVIITVRNNLEKGGFPELPTAESILDATAPSIIAWSAQRSLVKEHLQCDASMQEQTRVVTNSMLRMRQYQEPSRSLSKSICIIGGPGVGKSTLLQLLLLQAASWDLNVGMTALMAERARELGGHHLNQMFAIPVNEKASVPRLAELAVINLTRQPKRMAFLQRIDVLFIDELGQVSAEMIAVLDLIMRRIRDNSIFMGGILLFCTMDPLQLRPVSGRPALMSPHMITCFSFEELRQSVRASKDAFLREIQSYTRKHPAELTNHDVHRFRNLIESHCTFVKDWNDPILQPNMMRVFGKKAAAREAEQFLLSQAKRQFSTTMLLRESMDEESTPEGNWIPATQHTTRTLSRKVKEPSKLYFFPGAQYEITFNDPNGRFSQSQLAILLSMPTREQIDRFEPINILIAPEGCKSVSPHLKDMDCFKSCGWKQVAMGTSFERPEFLGHGVLGRRLQYGLRHRMACTIHSSMGQNLTQLVTKVTTTEESQYFLWEREQVVVLLSRTYYAKDIFFVGDPKETSQALAELLWKSSQYSEYIYHLLRQFTGRRNKSVPTVDMSLHPFHVNDIELPQDSSGFVYILISVKDKCSTYIGQTKNLVRRLKEHNSGFGSSSTADDCLRPWAILAYVTGFDACPRARLAFEMAWKCKRDQMLHQQRRMTPEAIARLAVVLIESRPSEDLRFVMCSFPTQYTS